MYIHACIYTVHCMCKHRQVRTQVDGRVLPVLVGAEIAAVPGLAAPTSCSMTHAREFHLAGTPSDAYTLGRSLEKVLVCVGVYLSLCVCVCVCACVRALVLVCVLVSMCVAHMHGQHPCTA